MSTIDIDALAVIANALDDAGLSCRAEQLAAFIWYLDDKGWQITRKPVGDQLCVPPPGTPTTLEPEQYPATRPDATSPDALDLPDEMPF